MSLTQANRFVAVETPLGPDALIVRSVSCSERISRLFQIDLDLISEDGEITFEDLIGEKATIRLEAAKDQTRYFNGIISRLVQTKNDGSYAHYRATIVPWLWLLTRTSDCRIFQKKSIPDIIEEVFKGHGLDSYRLSLSGNYPPWDFCVQYRETDFNFVSRLMEQEGIYYFFEHEDGKHTLVLADSVSAHETYSGYETMIYRPPSDKQVFDRECVTDWVVEKELQTGAYALNDFNFETPKASLLAKSVIQRPHTMADFEVYDYPGEYELHSEGEGLAKVRIEELQSTYETLRAQATARGICPGYLFTLQDHPRDDQNREYVITSMSCQMDAGDFESGGRSGAGEYFSCSFSCIESQTPFRPARITPKPLIQGPQTAVVVGPAGEEIHTDEHARVVVQFPWDRNGKSNENSSCWVRVSQAWAGKGWGSIHIPRIGQEVIVEFLEGDPDRPIITGRVYNGEARAPYALPGDKTQSGIKSRSSKGGGDDNFNEIRFEDKKGSEEMYIHAEKDQSIIVENDRDEAVGRDRSLDVGRDKSEEIHRNKLITVDGSHTEQVQGSMSVTVANSLTEMVGTNYAETVGAAMELTVGGALAITVGAAMAETIAAAKTEAIGGSKTESIGSNKTVTTGKDLTETVGKNRTVQIGTDLKENIGGQHNEEVTKEYILKAKKVQIVAEEQLHLKAGSAEVLLKKNGDITIKGNKINIKGDGDVTVKGSKILGN